MYKYLYTFVYIYLFDLYKNINRVGGRDGKV